MADFAEEIRTPSSAGRFEGVSSLGRAARRIQDSPGRAAWLLVWDGATALALFLIAAYALAAPEALGPTGFALSLAILGRTWLTEAAWLRFLTHREEGGAAIPLRIGMDELRLAGAAMATGFVIGLVGLLIFIPFFILEAGIGMAGEAAPPFLSVLSGWPVMVLTALAALFLVPRFQVVMALTIARREFRPMTFLAAAGAVQGRIALGTLVLVIVLAGLALLIGVGLQALPAFDSFAAVGVAVDRVEGFEMRAPLSAADLAVTLATAVFFITGWLLMRGLAAEAALSDDMRARLEDAPIPPVSPASPDPAPEAA